MTFTPLMNPLRLIGFVFVSALLSGTALPNQSIQTRIISGGEVAIMEVGARYDGQTIAVWGTGFEIFPHQTCGYPQMAFVDANGRVLLRKDAVYKTSYWRRTFENRFVSFSVNVPISAAVTSVFVRHQSTGGCEHAWSLEYALDWLLTKMFSPRR
jgi:hypothetical protein